MIIIDLTSLETIESMRELHNLIARAVGEAPLPDQKADADYAKDFLEDKTGEHR